MKIDRHVLPWLMIGLGMLFIVYNYFIQVAPSVMSHQLLVTYKIGAKGLGLLGSLFLFAYAFMQIPAGLLLDRFGARRMLTLAIFISGVGVCLFGLSHAFAVAGFSRVLAGAGAAFSFLGGLYIASRWFEHQRFALIAGTLQLGAGIGSIVGEAPLAAIVNHYGWRSATLGTGIVMFAMSTLFWLIVRDSPETKVSKKPIESATSTFHVFGRPQVWWLAFYNFVTWAPAGAIGALWGVPYLMHVYGWKNTMAGEAFIALWISVGLMAPVLGWLSDRIGRRLPVLVGALLIGLAGSLILYFADHLPAAIVVFGLFLLGIPAASQSAAFGTLKDNVSHHHYSSASALCNMATLLGGAIGQLIIGYLIAWHWTGVHVGGIPFYTVGDYKTGLFILPILFITCLITTCFFVRETFCRRIHA